MTILSRKFDVSKNLHKSISFTERYSFIRKMIEFLEFHLNDVITRKISSEKSKILLGKIKKGQKFHQKIKILMRIKSILQFHLEHMTLHL